MYRLRSIKMLPALVMGLGLAATTSAQPLNGIYTIGGATPNYATLTAAVTALNTNGVSGPVTFNIRNGSYTGQATVSSITGASAANRITFRSETGNAANVTLAFNGTATTNNFVLKLNGASFITIRDLTLKNEGASYGRAIEMANATGNDSLVNCILSTTARTASSLNTAVLYADNITGNNNVFVGNTFLNGSYSVYFSGTGTTNLANNGVFLNNTLQNAYVYGVYLYYTNNVKFNYNTVTTNSASTAYYAIRSYYGDGAMEIVGNKVTGAKGGYGIYQYYSDASAADKGLVANNVISFGVGSTTAHGLRSAYSSYQRIYNNSVNITSTSATGGYAAYFYYNNDDYATNEIKNNVFANTGGGYALFVQAPTYAHNMDYNNLYTTGTKLVDRGTPAADYTDLSSWRAAHGYDMNSISYDPGFTSATDLTPNAAAPASWSLNGRGIQIAGNDKDINGNARLADLALGVPDIGAYEFTPTAIPPNATPSPATPVAGTTQVFTFGQDTVAAISWDASAPVPATISVKQYSGVQPAGITTINPNFMYFYTNIEAGTGAFSYAADVYYKESWLGTIAAESSLRLAKRTGTNPWVGFNPSISKADENRNIIHTTGLTELGDVTGIDILNNAGTGQITEPAGYFCAGTYPVKLEVRNNGGNVISNVKIAWQIDGGAVSTISYTTPIASGGSAIVTLGNLLLNGAHIIKAWTVDPNGTTDRVAVDDTVTTRLRTSLNGTYTIGGATPDYRTIEAAVNDLRNSGICGRVTFNIRNGNYAERIQVDSIVGASSVNRVTFRSESGNATDVIITAAGTLAADNYVFRLSNASFVTIKDISMTSTGTDFGRVFEMAGNSSNDSLLNCRLTGPVRTASSTNTVVFFADPLTGSDNVFIGNTFSNGAYSIYYSGTSTTALTERGVFLNNRLENAYAYAAYFYYANDLKFNNNTVTTNSTYATFYGIRCYYCDGGLEIKNNTVKGQQGGYGMYLYYCDGTPANRGMVANNVVVVGSGTATANGIRSGYSSYQSIYNNSVNINSGSLTAGYAGYFYYSSATYKNNEVKNNVFANSGSGYAMYVQSTNPVYANTWDYNNLYTTGNNLVDDVTAGAEHKSLDEWRRASGQDRNSISYDPGFRSSTDLMPDATNAASWSLNGRGVHIAGNNKDILGNTRVVDRANGVPDIGAYEFTSAATPPAAASVSVTGPAGDKEYYTFGGDTVAVISWNGKVKGTLAVRQYTDVIAPQLTTASPSSFMYFYTLIDPANITYDFDANIYYKKPWLGTIANEVNVKLAHRVGTNPWVAYEAASFSDTNRAFINGVEGLTRFGLFTGIDSNNIFSAYAMPASSTVICAGGSVQLKANTGAGYTYQWNKNGSVISGANTASYTATAAGDYTVTISSSRGMPTSVPVTVTIIAAPLANVTHNGALTYCPGGSLTLDAKASPGNTYQWQSNGVDIVGATVATYDVTGAGTYSVRVANLGCSTTSAPVLVNADPVAVNLGADIAACEKQNAPLILDASNPGAKYVWSTGDTTQTIAVNKAGDYWVQVIAGPGCMAADTVKLKIDPLPTVTGISSQRAGNTYKFTASGVQNATSYVWIFDENGTITSSNDAEQPARQFPSGVKVKLIVSNTCGSDTAEYSPTTGIENATSGGADAKLYPNPASTMITLELAADNYLTDVMVVNSVGAVVYKQAVSKEAKLTINISDLPAGYYILKAVTTNGTVNRPFNIVK